MNDQVTDQESHRTFQIMTVLESGEVVSQRELAGRLGIAVGLVNSYLKNFVAKGYVRVKAFPRNRYAYLLTPKGFAEKSRLAYQHLNYFTSLYTATRQEYLELFRQMKRSGVQEVSFCGVDEVAEIAYLSLQETGLRLAEVLDRQPLPREVFFGMAVRDVASGYEPVMPVVITSLKRREELAAALTTAGIAADAIRQPDARRGGGA